MKRSKISLEEQEELRSILDRRKVLDAEILVHMIATCELEKENDSIKKRFREILDTPDKEEETNKEIILEYCDNIQTGDMDYLQKCIDVRDALRNTKIDHKELLNRLDGSCPSASGLEDHVGICYETVDDDLSNEEKYDQCKRCWKKVLA